MSTVIHLQTCYRLGLAWLLHAVASVQGCTCFGLTPPGFDVLPLTPNGRVMVYFIHATSRQSLRRAARFCATKNQDASHTQFVPLVGVFTFWCRLQQSWRVRRWRRAP